MCVDGWGFRWGYLCVRGRKDVSLGRQEGMFLLVCVFSCVGLTCYTCGKNSFALNKDFFNHIEL